jgi:hypothetical protein
MTGESIRTPTWFALFWVEPTADPASTTGMVAISGAPPRLQATPSTPLPSGVRMLADPRGVIFQPSSPQPLPRALLDSDFTLLPAPASPPGPITVNVASLDGRFHPRVVHVTPPAALAAKGALPIYAPLWSSLRGTSVGEAGALTINLQWPAPAGTLKPGSWAVLTLACTRNGAKYGFAAQADVNGDVIVPLTGLPPPPASTSAAPPPDVMTLTVHADPTLSGIVTGADTDAVLKLAPIGVTASGGATAVTSLPLVWGQINTAVTLGLPGFTLTPA